MVELELGVWSGGTEAAMAASNITGWGSCFYFLLPFSTDFTYGSMCHAFHVRMGVIHNA